MLCPLACVLIGSSEEFGIYLNYVRKLGFEETPDYEFLRELFTKVLKNSGEMEDEVYDWMMLNGGKGWESGSANVTPSPWHIQRSLTCAVYQISSANLLAASNQQGASRTRTDQTRVAHRASQQHAGAGVTPPTPALVRQGSKQRHVPAALTPGGGAATPNSAAAHMGVPAPSPARRLSNQAAQQHPYANNTGAVLLPSDYGHGRGAIEGSYAGAAYGRNSPMVSSVGAATPPALTNVRARGGEVGVANGNGDYDAQQTVGETKKPSIWRILTCRCG